MKVIENKISISIKSDLLFWKILVFVGFFHRILAAVTSSWTKDLSARVALYTQFFLPVKLSYCILFSEPSYFRLPNEFDSVQLLYSDSWLKAQTSRVLKG